MKPLYYRSVNSKGADRPRLTHHHKGGWNETKWMRWVWRNDGMKFVVGENGRNLRKKPTQTPFRPPRNPHGGTETRTRDPYIHNIINNFFYGTCAGSIALTYFWNLRYLFSSSTWSRAYRLKIDAGRVSLLAKQTIALLRDRLINNIIIEPRLSFEQRKAVWRTENVFEVQECVQLLIALVVLFCTRFSIAVEL